MERIAWIGTLGAPLLLLGSVALAETDTPVTMERSEGAVRAEEFPVENGPHPTGLLWHTPVEVRTRAVSGLPLTDEERAEVRALAVTCPNGGVAEDVEERSEEDNTLVLRFVCTLSE